MTFEEQYWRNVEKSENGLRAVVAQMHTKQYPTNKVEKLLQQILTKLEAIEKEDK